MRKKNIFFVMDTFWRVSHEGSVASVGTCPFPCRLMSKGPLPCIPTLSSKFFSNASLTQPLRERFALQSSLSYQCFSISCRVGHLRVPDVCGGYQDGDRGRRLGHGRGDRRRTHRRGRPATSTTGRGGKTREWEQLFLQMTPISGRFYRVIHMVRWFALTLI